MNDRTKETLNAAKRRIADAAEQAAKRLDRLYSRLPLDQANAALNRLPFQVNVRTRKFKIAFFSLLTLLIVLIASLLIGGRGNGPKNTVAAWREAVLETTNYVFLDAGPRAAFEYALVLGTPPYLDSDLAKGKFLNAELTEVERSPSGRYACVRMSSEGELDAYFLLKKFGRTWKIISVNERSPNLKNL